MVRRLVLGVSSALLVVVGVFLVQPHLLWSASSVLQICVIEHVGDPCGGSGGGGTTVIISGGGGGGNGAPNAYNPTSGEVYFQGLAYPGSVVSLVRDGQVIATTNAGSDATFQFDITGVTPGTYMYGVLSTDARGVKSVTNSFAVAVTPGVGTVISGIYLAPTIQLDKETVKRGDPVVAFGASAPNSEVNVLVHSSEELLKTTSSDNKGLWTLTIDTLGLEYGQHDASARWKNTSGISPLSSSATFTVGTTSATSTLSGGCGREIADINCDSHVNIVDFSIMAYWYHRTLTAAGQKADLNHDGRINLVDFSILAYHWTG